MATGCKNCGGPLGMGRHGKVCRACYNAKRHRPPAPPPPPKSASRAIPAAEVFARRLAALATEADAAGLRGSGQRLREHADALREDPTDARAREVARLVAEACVRAREEIGDDGRAVYLLWRRALPATWRAA